MFQLVSNLMKLLSSKIIDLASDRSCSLTSCEPSKCPQCDLSETQLQENMGDSPEIQDRDKRDEVLIYYDRNTKLKKDGNYYVVAQNGIWFHKDDGVFCEWKLVDGIECLEFFVPSKNVVYKLPKIPTKDSVFIQKFLSRVFSKHSDCKPIVAIYWDSDNKKFDFDCFNLSHSNLQIDSVLFKDNLPLVGVVYIPDMVDLEIIDELSIYSDNYLLRCEFSNFSDDYVNFDIVCFVNTSDPQNYIYIDPLYVFEFNGKEFGKSLHMLQIELTAEEIKKFEIKIQKWISKLYLDDQTDNELHAPNEKDFKEFNLEKQLSVNKNDISIGDLVEWNGTKASKEIQDLCGKGPFTVIGKFDDNVVIDCQIGKVFLNKNMFIKL